MAAPASVGAAASNATTGSNHRENERESTALGRGPRAVMAVIASGGHDIRRARRRPPDRGAAGVAARAGTGRHPASHPSPHTDWWIAHQRRRSGGHPGTNARPRQELGSPPAAGTRRPARPYRPTPQLPFPSITEG